MNACNNLLSLDDIAIPLLHPMFVEVSGKCGNFVFFMNRGKKCVRRHVVPRDPRTGAQIARRKVFASVVSQWQALPSLTKDCWRARARDIEARQSSGDKAVSGYSLFLSVNLNRCYAGLPVLRVLPFAVAKNVNVASRPRSRLIFSYMPGSAIVSNFIESVYFCHFLFLHCCVSPPE